MRSSGLPTCEEMLRKTNHHFYRQKKCSTDIYYNNKVPLTLTNYQIFIMVWPHHTGYSAEYVYKYYIQIHCSDFHYLISGLSEHIHQHVPIFTDCRYIYRQLATLETFLLRYIDFQNSGCPPSWNCFTTTWDHPRSLCCWPQLPVKFHVNLIHRSEDIAILFKFFAYLAWNAYSGPRNGGFGRFWTHKCDYSSSRPPKGTSLSKSASYKLSTVKICWGVWPVRELTERKCDGHTDTQVNLYSVHALHSIVQTIIITFTRSWVIIIRNSNGHLLFLFNDAVQAFFSSLKHLLGSWVKRERLRLYLYTLQLRSERILKRRHRMGQR